MRITGAAVLGIGLVAALFCGIVFLSDQRPRDASVQAGLNEPPQVSGPSLVLPAAFAGVFIVAGAVLLASGWRTYSTTAAAGKPYQGKPMPDGGDGRRA